MVILALGRVRTCDVIDVMPAMVEKLPFDRRRDRGRHGFRRSRPAASQSMEMVGKSTGGSAATGEQPGSRRPQNNERCRDQRRHHRPANAGLGQSVHLSGSDFSSAPGATRRVPLVSSSCPSVTTALAAVQASVDHGRCRRACDFDRHLAHRRDVVLDRHRQTYPDWLTCTAAVGRPVTARPHAQCQMLQSTSVPGHNSSASFGHVWRAQLNMPVATPTVFSIMAHQCPVARSTSAPGVHRWPTCRATPASIAVRSSGSDALWHRETRDVRSGATWMMVAKRRRDRRGARNCRPSPFGRTDAAGDRRRGSWCN